MAREPERPGYKGRRLAIALVGLLCGMASAAALTGAARLPIAASAAPTARA